ncbi:universal stress protein [Ensifer sp. LCM 4579]|uniref:universal stress protein n=1 Tax=Ensifer sp. LCM 4579 TaxID=1848292 RepID=UPI0008DA5E25|nr:universal stress protein [Ensifer sp. LCM 4579]OHV78452.1 hypothetical protein LCM4579_25980 [Ensifer sp. LCM 4579]
MMFKKILIATDGSEHAQKAVEVGSDIAAKNGAEVVLVHVSLMGETDEDVQQLVENLVQLSSPSDLDELDEKDAVTGGPTSLEKFNIVGNELLKLAEVTARAHGVGTITKRLLDGDPTEQILKAIREEGADLVVCGARGLSSFSALVLGSISNKIAHLSPVTCVTVR